MASAVAGIAKRPTALTGAHPATHRFRTALNDRRQRLALWQRHEISITLHIRRRKAAYHLSDRKFPLTVTLGWVGLAHSQLVLGNVSFCFGYASLAIPPQPSNALKPREHPAQLPG
jgi:hypothetical protein